MAPSHLVAGRALLDTSLTPRDWSASLSPRAIYDLSRRQDKTRDGQPWIKGSGAVDPNAFNNKLIFTLFGLVGVSLVLLAIWFFFWAKNGGFVFRKGDWEDYKSTVLRRKGRDGKTLSNATPRTNLGIDSIRGEYDHPEEFESPTRTGGGGGGGGHRAARAGNGGDDDVRRYRHEKPARVGGLNRKADGSHYETTNTDRSEYSAAAPPSMEEIPVTMKQKKRGKGFLARVVSGDGGNDKEEMTKKASHIHSNTKHKGQTKGRDVSAAYSFVQGDDSSVGDSTYLNEQRQQRQRQHHRQQQRPSQHEYRRQASRSPRKSYAATDCDTLFSDHHTTISYGDTTTSYGDPSVTSADTGTKSYPHHIPGLTQLASPIHQSPAFRDQTSSPRRAARTGLRSAGPGPSPGPGPGPSPGGRGGRRRDSLSESD